MEATKACPCCGKQTELLGREVRFNYPDVVAALSVDQRAARFLQAGTAFASLDDQCFLRVLLPVRLDIGHVYRFGVWLSVDTETARKVWTVWDTDEYKTLTFSGRLANSVPPWGEILLGAPCQARVFAQASLPEIVESTFEPLQDILKSPWPLSECKHLIDQVWKNH
jgi:hypothetical protein